MRREVDQEFQRYATGMPGVREAMTTDAAFAAQMQLIRRLVATVDLALDAEGIAADVRTRVVRTILFGAPDPAAAEVRIEQLRQMTDLASRGLYERADTP